MKQGNVAEEHRRACEARQVLAWPFRQRKPYLELVGKRRGDTARKELEMEVIRQHKQGRA